jgi:hypothetical protein
VSWQEWGRCDEFGRGQKRRTKFERRHDPTWDRHVETTKRWAIVLHRLGLLFYYGGRGKYREGVVLPYRFRKRVIVVTTKNKIYNKFRSLGDHHHQPRMDGGSARFFFFPSAFLCKVPFGEVDRAAPLAHVTEESWSVRPR